VNYNALNILLLFIYNFAGPQTWVTGLERLLLDWKNWNS